MVQGRVGCNLLGRCFAPGIPWQLIRTHKLSTDTLNHETNEVEVRRQQPFCDQGVECTMLPCCAKDYRVVNDEQE